MFNIMGTLLNSCCNDSQSFSVCPHREKRVLSMLVFESDSAKLELQVYVMLLVLDPFAGLFDSFTGLLDP